MDRFIETVVATADHVKAVRRQREDRSNISFDEWNVWYLDRFQNVDKIEGLDNWPIAPRLLEDVYSVADAVVFGNLMISLLKHADRVTSASLAQLVNVIAPIMTEPGGPAWRQTTFFPFAITSRLAQGEALELKLDVADVRRPRTYGEVPLVDAVATHDAETGRIGRVPREPQPGRAADAHGRHRRPSATCRCSRRTPSPTTTCTRRTRSTSPSGSRRGRTTPCASTAASSP